MTGIRGMKGSKGSVVGKILRSTIVMVSAQRANLTIGISSTLFKIVAQGPRGVPVKPGAFGWPPH